MDGGCKNAMMIVFFHNMTIKLKGEFWISTYKTINSHGIEIHIYKQISIH
uniref:Uncharacterized protein n=1 Tax=Physcomitrium patens TaxID=3218 RepID=A0A2K1JRA2_PHYPA|nr:hypothetical protein PHYPA_016442 [Physcomitrium patens]